MAEAEKTPAAPKPAGWASIINSVRTPLGYFSLVALVLDAVMVAIAGLTQQVSLLAPLGVLLLLAVGVGVIAYLKPLALYHPSEWPSASPRVTVTVALTFPAPVIPIDVEFDVDSCVVQIRDHRGHVKLRTIPNLRAAPGGCAVRLPVEVEEADSVSLELVERGGRLWSAGPFAPFEREARCSMLRARVDQA